MIDFGQIESPIKLTTEWVLSKVEDHQIFRYYFGEFELGKVYSSKFRRDSTPSTGFYISKNGALLYNDFRTGEKLNCFTYVAKIYNLSFKEAIKRIALDFGLIKGGSGRAQDILDQAISFDREYKKTTLIQFIPGKWTTNRVLYWNQYEITVPELKREEVYPVDKLFINKVEIKVDELCFAYVVRERVKGKENVYIKIYSPFSQRMKWLSNIPISVPFGLNNLSYKSHRLIIGKAQKDRLVLLKLFPSVIGTQNESESALPDDLVKHLCFNFDERIIMWDNDETGVENCKKFNPKGFGYFNIPKTYSDQGIKDVSDLVAVYGIKRLEKLLKDKNIIL
jgi:hypothetical protein